ncbi:hypothetical protein FACS1894122_03550 [Alphaproteobacteria bacterium]|nr:hypothetical protein FACS1894122_03550 [Alphaproteobacteria bacterium]
MATMAEQIKMLRERIGGGGLSECKYALEECGEDVEKAIEWLKKEGIVDANGKYKKED